LCTEKLKTADERRNDELNYKLEEVLTQKQEAEAKNEEYLKKIAALEDALKTGNFSQKVCF